MRRGRLRLAGLAAGAALAAAVTATPAYGDTPAPSSAVATSKGYASSVARTPSGAPVDSAAGELDVRRYWTAERMRAATPARPPAYQRGAGTAGTAGTAAVWSEPRPPSPEAIAAAATAAGVPMSAVDAAVSSTVGKVFFVDPIDGREHQCSGATVNSTKRRLVVTAGHCVHNGLWMLGFIFAPQYNNGLHPVYGQWIAGNLAARTDWIFFAQAGADVGVAIMNNNFLGQRIVDVVGGNGLAWNQPLGQHVDILGYPAEAPFNGLTQQSCSGTTFGGVDVNEIGMGPCNFNAGGSGSPMLLSYGALGAGRGYVSSVFANVYTPRPGEAFGPYFEDVNAGLFYYAESISPF
jgi:V8-like Glu-specific endopeptidase